MGGGGKGGSNEQVEVNTDPWVGQQGHLSSLYGQAAGLGQQQPYPYPGVVPFSPATLGSQVMQTGRALAGSPVQRAGQAQNFATTTGQYLGAQPGAGHLQPFTEAQDPYGYARHTVAGLGRLTPFTRTTDIAGYEGAPQLQRTAGGEYLLGGEGFDAAYEAGARKVLPQVAGQFTSAGRYGSGLHQASTTEALGDVFAGLYGQERSRQEAAAAQLSGLSANERARATQAAGQYGSLYGQERARATQASLAQQMAAQQAASQLSSQASGAFQGERQRQLQASLAAPSMAQADYADIGALGAVGASQEAKARQALQDAQQRWAFQQQAPYSQLGMQSGVIQGGNWGGQQTQTSPLYSNPIASAAGGAMVGGSLASAYPSMGVTGPYGMAAGAGLGLMSSMK